MATSDIESAQRNLVMSWAQDPLKFVTEALKVKFVSTQQRHGFEELRKLVWAKIKKSNGEKLTAEEKTYARKVGISIMSGKGTGKDAFSAMAIIWFLCCFPRPVIPCVAPTSHQLRDVLWKELNKWRVGDYNDPPVIKDWLVYQTDKLYFAPSKGREWFAIARTANPKDNPEEQAETLQGFHEPYMMIVVDEASAVPEAVFKPLEGTLTGICNFLLVIFNPTRPTGFAIETQTKNRDDFVCLHWDAEESELVPKDKIEREAEKYGRDSNYFRITVSGYPPKSTADTLVPWEWAIDAIDRELEALPDDPDLLGIDVGAGGDPTIIAPMRGPLVLPLEQNESADSEALTGWLMSKIFEYDPKFTFVDVIGVGWAIEGNLRSRIATANIVGVNVSELPAEDYKFHRLRDELCWRVREKFERRVISIPNDPILIGELTTIKFEEPNGKIKVESKRELRRRGLKSPNRFDALCLAHYYDTNVVRKIAKKRNKRGWRHHASNWRTV